MNNFGIRAIHRLDRDTTGINLFAKRPVAFEAYRTMWQEKAVEKRYYAIASGEARFRDKTVSQPVEGKSAVSHIRTECAGYGITVFGINIETGRKHQIRLHLKSLGHPVLGDSEYGESLVRAAWKKSVERQMLHAAKMSFADPWSGRPITISSGVPADFAEIAAKAGWKSG